MKYHILLLFLLISLSGAFVPAQCQVPEDLISLEVEFDPEPAFSQMIYGEHYDFSVIINNLNLDLEEGDITSLSPKTKFSGDIVVHVSFTVNKEGDLVVGASKEAFVHPLLSWEESNDVRLPEVESLVAIPYSYTSTSGYGSGVNPDDWVTFNIDIQVYLWEYIEISGEPDRYLLSNSIGETHLKFYIISNTKIAYVEDVLEAMDQEIDAAKEYVAGIEAELGRDIDVDFTGYEVAYGAMSYGVNQGDYVSAMVAYEGYEPTWRDDFVSALQGEVDAFEGLIEDYADQFNELTTNYEELQSQIEDVAAKDAEIADLETQIETLQSNSRLYIFGMVALGAVLVVALLRLFGSKLFRKKV